MRKKEGTRDFLKNRSESTSTVGELRKIDFVGIATSTGMGREWGVRPFSLP
jgi:hypothetical protein